MHGNSTVDKDDFVRGLLAAMKAGETVGILMDTNMTPPQGVFVDFFGIPACTASGLARIALRTDAAVVPGFTVWDPALGKYRLRFDPAINLIRTGNDDADALANTALFTKIIEDYVRKYPDQWLVGASAMEDQARRTARAVLADRSLAAFRTTRSGTRSTNSMNTAGIVAARAHHIGKMKSATSPSTVKLIQKIFFSMAIF